MPLTPAGPNANLVLDLKGIHDFEPSDRTVGWEVWDQTHGVGTGEYYGFFLHDRVTGGWALTHNAFYKASERPTAFHHASFEAALKASIRQKTVNLQNIPRPKNLPWDGFPLGEP